MDSSKKWPRRLAIAGGIALAMLVGAAAGLAWTQEVPAQRGRGPGVPGGGSPVFAALDANHDGTVTGDELASAPAALARLDRDGNGALEPAELRPAFGRGGRGPGGRGGPGDTPAATPDEIAAALMAFDGNGDGTLTRAEVPERMQGLFDRADADKSGSLTEAELKAAAAQGGPRGERGMPGERTGGGGRDGRGPEGGPRRGDPLVAALDTNKDGTLGGDELAGAAGSLATLDADGDGQLTRAEVRAAFGRGGREPQH